MNSKQNKTILDDIIDEHAGQPEHETERLALHLMTQIRDEMSRQNVTQSELASRLGVTQPDIAKKLSFGHNMTLRSLVELAVGLHCTWEFPRLVPQAPASAQSTERTTKARPRRERTIAAKNAKPRVIAKRYDG